MGEITVGIKPIRKHNIEMVDKIRHFEQKYSLVSLHFTTINSNLSSNEITRPHRDPVQILEKNQHQCRQSGSNLLRGKRLPCVQKMCYFFFKPPFLLFLTTADVPPFLSLKGYRPTSFFLCRSSSCQIKMFYLCCLNHRLFEESSRELRGESQNLYSP